MNDEEMGKKMLRLLEEQKKTFLRLADGTKLVTNRIVYNSLEEELYDIQKKIGAVNKKRLRKMGANI